MQKITDILRETIVKQPFLEEALQYGFLNLTAFAEYIRPFVEQTSQKTVSIHAIKMALSRLPSPVVIAPASLGILPDSITTRSGLAIMTLVKTPESVRIVTKLMNERPGQQKYFFNVIEGIMEIDLVYDQQIHDLTDELPSSLQLLKVSDLGLCTLHLSDREIATPGLFYRVSKKLAFHGINIVQILSTYHELGIIVAGEDLKKTVSVLMG